MEHLYGWIALVVYILLGLLSTKVYFKYFSKFEYNPDDWEDMATAFLLTAFWPVFVVLATIIKVFSYIFKRIL